MGRADTAKPNTSHYFLRSNSEKMKNVKTINSLVKENNKLKRVIGTQSNVNKNMNQIAMQNRFSILDDDKMNWNDNDQPNSSSKKNQTPKPPPIKITDDRMKTFDMKRFLNDLQITSFQAKTISIGIKVDLDTKSDYDKCITALTTKKIDFFTHRDKNEKSFKVVLGGLPKMDTGIIVDEMKKYNIVPSSVTELSTKNQNPHHCLYLVQFNTKDVSFNILRKVRAIDHIIVNWKPFKPRNRGPTQCNKCLMFGHGAQNCHRSEACMLCASTSHATANCHYNENTKEAFVFKCYNCVSKNLPNTNHRANDPKCPCRSTYLEIRNNINHKNTIRNSRTNQKSNTFNINQTNFPEFNQNSSPEDYTPNQSTGPTYAEQIKRSRANSDLYSMDDLFEIFQSAIEDLSVCTNKGQQLKVLFKLLSNAYE